MRGAVYSWKNTQTRLCYFSSWPCFFASVCAKHTLNTSTSTDPVTYFLSILCFGQCFYHCNFSYCLYQFMICSYAIYFLQISVCAVSYVFFQLCGRPVQCLSLCLILALTLPSTKNMTQIFSCKVFIYESSMLEIKRFKQRATHQCSVSAFVCMILALPLQSTNYMMQMFSSKIRIK